MKKVNCRHLLGQAFREEVKIKPCISLRNYIIVFPAGNATMMEVAMVFTLIGKMGITAAFSTLYLLTPESYPTNLR